MADKLNQRNLYAIVGTQYRGKAAVELLASLPADAPLYLIRDPGNKYDANAVMVWAAVDGERKTVMHIGFVPKDQNKVLSKFIDDQGLTAEKLAFDSSAEADVVVAAAYGNQVVRAKLHKGGNTQPLAEVVG